MNGFPLISVLACNVSAILILLLKTDFVFEYLNLAPLNPIQRFILLLNQYKNERHLLNYPNYIFYLAQKWSNRPVASFFLKMLTCAYCAGFWLSLAVSLVFGAWWMIGPVYIIGLLLFFILDIAAKKV